jgi:hypothetical protein
MAVSSEPRFGSVPFAESKRRSPKKYLYDTYSQTFDQRRSTVWQTNSCSTNGLASIFTRSTPFQPEPFHKCLVEWILVDCILKLKVWLFENWFQQFALKLLAFFQKGDTVRSWTMQRFNAAQQEVKQQLLDAVSKIYISCDLWSSPNGYAFLGVVAHWTSPDKELHTTSISIHPGVLRLPYHCLSRCRASCIQVCREFRIFRELP